MKKGLVAAAAAASLLAFAAVGLAITNGGPDGNGHPEVGALLAPHAYSDGTWEACSGTLISPTVFLTAAHCDEGVSRVAVTFDSVDDAKTGAAAEGRRVTMGAGGATFHSADIRYVATGSVSALTKAWIRASMNPSTGDGGTCYGDSGGPNFLGDTNIVAGTTITGDFVCRATNVDYRMDTESARSFLGQYVTLP